MSVGSVEKKGQLPAADEGSTSEGEDLPQETWCPTPEELEERNITLAADPEMKNKQFKVVDKTCPVSTLLLRILPSIHDRSLDKLPPPHVVIFNAILQSFCADPSHAVMTTAVCRMWLVLLMESIAVHELHMRIFPKTKADRVFERVGDFMKVCVWLCVGW